MHRPLARVILAGLVCEQWHWRARASGQSARHGMIRDRQPVMDVRTGGIFAAPAGSVVPGKPASDQPAAEEESHR
jgi:hypothetical protein